MKRLSLYTLLVVILVVLAVLLSLLTEAHAASRPQVLASVLLRAGAREAQVELVTVDASSLHRRLTARELRRGVTLFDDAGRSIRIRGASVVVDAPDYGQTLLLSDFRIPRTSGAVVRATHLFVALVDGDYEHPIWLCASPERRVGECVRMWRRRLK